MVSARTRHAGGRRPESPVRSLLALLGLCSVTCELRLRFHLATGMLRGLHEVTRPGMHLALCLAQAAVHHGFLTKRLEWALFPS